jgi:hypothetical protein
MFQIVQANSNDISEIQRLAERIWREHFPEIIGLEQVEYMLPMMYGDEVLQDEFHPELSSSVN